MYSEKKSMIEKSLNIPHGNETRSLQMWRKGVTSLDYLV